MIQDVLGPGIIITSLVILAATCTPFLLIAGFLWWRGASGTAAAKAAMTWPSVLGVVVSSNVEVSHSSHPEGGTSTSYFPRVVYDYEVLGHRYRGGRLAFGDKVGSGFSGQAQAVVDRYIPGNQIRVYYDPGNPGESVLERQAPAGNILRWIAVFIVVLVFCSVCATVPAVIAPVVFTNSLLESLPK